MTPDESPTVFPHYEPPRHHGVVVADPGFGKPLMKLMKSMMRKPPKIKRLPKSVRKVKHRHRFY